MQESIKEILIRRDGMTSEEADELIRDAKRELNDLIEAGCTFEVYNFICEDWFGLEPDSLGELATSPKEILYNDHFFGE